MATSPRMKMMMLSAFALLVTSAARADQRGNGREKQATFGSWFEQQVAAPTPLPPDVREVARRYRYVFVAGFLNQGFQVGYFNENKEALLEAGVSRDAIHIVFPVSVSSVEETVAGLPDIISALAAKGREKLVLIGHSKGAVEVLAFVLSNPAFVREHVQVVFLVQGALGGSAVADFLTGAGHPLDERMPARERAAFEVAARGGKLLDG